MNYPFDDLINALSHRLLVQEWKLATAESCTGGGLSYALTAQPGSAQWFERGFVTYSNLAKEELLGVTDATLERFGAVSEQTAREMAEGALKQSQAQVTVSITGIAGPDSDTSDKPVGLVWFAWAGIHRETQASLQRFLGDRQAVREQAIKAALEGLIQFI